MFLGQGVDVFLKRSAVTTEAGQSGLLLMEYELSESRVEGSNRLIKNYGKKHFVQPVPGAQWHIGDDGRPSARIPIHQADSVLEAVAEWLDEVEVDVTLTGDAREIEDLPAHGYFTHQTEYGEVRFSRDRDLDFGMDRGSREKSVRVEARAKSLEAIREAVEELGGKWPLTHIGEASQWFGKREAQKT